MEENVLYWPKDLLTARMSPLAINIYVLMLDLYRMSLKDNFNEDIFIIEPITQIEELGKYNRQKVRRILKELEEKGYIKKVNPNRYTKIYLVENEYTEGMKELSQMTYEEINEELAKNYWLFFKTKL